jgi:hypothetical protein
MSLICLTFTSWIEETILEPVNTWASQQQQQCNQLPWWNPLGWVCWLVTTTILVVVWVTIKITVPILTVICHFVTFIVGWVAMVIATLIVAVNPQSNAIQWVNLWFLARARISFVSRAPSAKAGAFDYVFTCHCRDQDHTITVTAVTDDDAAAQARIACIKACG